MKATFYDVISEAINDITAHGFDSQNRINEWLVKIHQAAMDSLVPEYRVEEAVNQALRGIYMKMITKGKLLEYHPGVKRFTLDMVAPKLHSELDRRIMANANLIKLNREQAVETTLRRFAGWSTSIPAGGSNVVDKNGVKTNIRKSLAMLPFEERRVAIDQGHKFISSLNSILAQNQNALGAIWHSRWRRIGYNYREDHKERDQKFYAMKGNWAIEKGLMKVGKYGYTTDITQPAEEVFCSCSYRYIYNLTDVPPDCLTEKGRKALEGAMVS